MSKNKNPVVRIFSSRREMGSAAALAVRTAILDFHQKQETVRMVFAAAPSQLEFLSSLVRLPKIPWRSVEAFHMDEYLGIARDDPRGFGYFLRENLFDRVNMGRVEYIDPSPPDPEEECRRYSDLLHENPIDVICMGIGENGHIAFNDPHVADFVDPVSVKVVDLDERCRQQQVNDGCFPKFELVPQHAITLTIPQLLSARELFVVVPGIRKAEAVYAALRGPLAPACPASILQTHARTEIFLDADAASLLRSQ